MLRYCTDTFALTVQWAGAASNVMSYDAIQSVLSEVDCDDMNRNKKNDGTKKKDGNKKSDGSKKNPASKKLDLWMNSFYLPVTNMLDVDEVGMGLVRVKHHAGFLPHGCTKVKTNRRKLATDLSRNGYLHKLYSDDDDENRLINEWISNQMNSKCYYNEAVFVLGPMGAGKTTVLQEDFKKHPVYKNYAYVDTDELMEKLDGFDSERVDEFYPRARSIAIKLTDWLLNENISFVAEGTCVKYSELEDYMQRLKRKGYVIRVKHVNAIPLEEILLRTSKRERKVPEDVVKSIYYGSLTGIGELKSKNINNELFEEI